MINTHAGSATEVAVLINPLYTDNLCVTDDLYPVIIIPKIVKSQPAPIFEIVTETATHAFNQWQKSASLNFFRGFHSRGTMEQNSGFFEMSLSILYNIHVHVQCVKYKTLNEWNPVLIILRIVPEHTLLISKAIKWSF